MRQASSSHWIPTAALALTALLVSNCGLTSAPNPLASRLLSAATLPSGWTATTAKQDSIVANQSPCFAGMPEHPKGFDYRVAIFVQGSAVPNLSEVVASGPSAGSVWSDLDRTLSSCHSATLAIAGKKVKTAISPLAFPSLGASSSAYAWRFTFSGMGFGTDMVLFESGKYVGYLAYSDLGSPSTAVVTAFAKAALAKIEGHPVGRIPGNLTITSAPMRTAHTSLGKVAYREIGSGPPLVMITGYGGTMTSWDRRFVDALASTHRVVIFDNAGIGGTQGLSRPLTIDEMANQTSALITSLGLRGTDVLGWSMGSMIAQALAVLHPAQVRRLVLCAPYPGTGAAVPPSRKTLNEFESGNPQEALSFLFPADQSAASTAYQVAISSYPPAATASAQVLSEQGRAVDQWWAGKNAAGLQTGVIRVPTLIADGTLDKLDPLANSRALATLIPGSTLLLYPDAGHAFLFQEKGFVSRVDAFLG